MHGLLLLAYLSALVGVFAWLYRRGARTEAERAAREAAAAAPAAPLPAPPAAGAEPARERQLA